MPDKGKGIAGENSEGLGDPAMTASNLAVTLGGKGILPSPKGPSIPSLKDCNSTGFVVKPSGMPKFIPKIKLVTFDGKETKAWLRKCINNLKYIMSVKGRWCPQQACF